MQTKTKEAKAVHTPGPWEYYKHKSGVHEIFGRELNPGIAPLIAQLSAVAHGSSQSRDEAEANARLIATAPELLAACKKVLALLDNSASTTSMPHTHAMLKAAIAKAEGR